MYSLARRRRLALLAGRGPRGCGEEAAAAESKRLYGHFTCKRKKGYNFVQAASSFNLLFLRINKSNKSIILQRKLLHKLAQTYTYSFTSIYTSINPTTISSHNDGLLHVKPTSRPRHRCLQPAPRPSHICPIHQLQPPFPPPSCLQHVRRRRRRPE
jgi:hypothetical protein